MERITLLLRPILTGLLVSLFHLSPAESDAQQTAHEASFTVEGAVEGVVKGNATVRRFKGSRRYFTMIEIKDQDTVNPDYLLQLRAESWEDPGLPAPGEYSITKRGDPELGFEAGFEVIYTHFLEYKGSYYANTALEYKAPAAWKATPNGKIIIESITDTHISGSFEFELMENTSINKAPTTGKGVRISQGKFNAKIEEPDK